MVRSELLTLVEHDNPGLSVEVVDAIVNAFFDSITAQLKAGGRVEVRGFGAFSTRERDAHIGRDPRNGALIEVERKRVIHFRPGRELAARVNASLLSTRNNDGAPPKRRTAGA